MIRMSHFQATEEFASGATITAYILAYLVGIVWFMTFSILFFFRITRHNKSYEVHSSEPIGSTLHKRDKWYEIFRRQKDRTSIYVGSRLKLIPSRSSKHFDKELVEKIFAKNRVSASIFELLTILIFFGLGFFNDYKYFEVPAATSIVLLLTICLMIFSALHSWLKGWVYVVFFFALIIMNSLSRSTGMFHYTSYAYGLDYDKAKNCVYSVDRLSIIAADSNRNNESLSNYTQILNNWKGKFKEEKPKLVLINTSGGGSRSALWTMTVLQEMDKRSNNQVSEHTQLITGASGGMIGAAYFRELLLRKHRDEIKSHTSLMYREDISKDMLNKLSFMASTNDIFIRYQKAEINGHAYSKDRGYAFESQLLTNTRNYLDHNLGYYKTPETKAVIPTMILTPTIINDGRRLFISSQSTNFLTSSNYSDHQFMNSFENVDIHSLLDNQETSNIRFTSALRASATFPFVMPMMTLPTFPEVQLMDAGIRDNYGSKTMMLFLHVMEDWIKNNTSGVIVVQIRDTRKLFKDETFKEVSFLDKITLPFGNMYKNFPKVQDYNQDELIKLGSKSLDFPVDIVTFNLLERKSDRISLSWHLTTQEKNKIYSALKSESNQYAFRKLERLMK
jgi:predicted acylesterase/phospholipase RssA